AVPPVPSAHMITISPFVRSTLFAGTGESLQIPQPELSGGQLGLVMLEILACAPKLTPPFVERRYTALRPLPRYVTITSPLGSTTGMGNWFAGEMFMDDDQVSPRSVDLLKLTLEPGIIQATYMLW